MNRLMPGRLSALLPSLLGKMRLSKQEIGALIMAAVARSKLP